ncbi:MAG: adenylyl cyclase, partial [Gammaproteobacteria bacterium]|nr:adenylyl cyclase [Gammaproteobacteria bacterium]
MSLFEELKRRNVFRVGIAYAVVAWVLLQVVDLVLDNIVAPEWIMKVFMLVVAVGFPVALIIAWAFEMTPEGLKRESEVDRTQSITPQTGHKLDRIIIMFLAAAVVVLLAERFISTPEEAEVKAITTTDTVRGAAVGETPIHVVSDKSIAVLPLVNRSANPEDAFFADGMHDELLTQLSRISALRVISRTSVMGYAGTTKRMPDIGRELGVATLLEGGVQRSGNRVRINVQLIEAA